MVSAKAAALATRADPRNFFIFLLFHAESNARRMQCAEHYSIRQNRRKRNWMLRLRNK
jgi:hypothetical protein